jgi:hypothetical protein
MLTALLAAQISSPIIVKHPPIAEMSGIVKSQTHSDTYWVHNDSGDVPRIFAINSKGGAIMPPFETGFWTDVPIAGKREWPGIKVENASNIDWEDITLDKGNLYISDMGNNGNARRDLGIYVVAEPNPLAVSSVRSLKFLPVRYPDQTAFPPKKWHFDCEAMFALRGKLFFLTKHRLDDKIGIPLDSTKLYRLDSMRIDRDNVLTKLDEASGLGGWVTGAAASPDGKRIAVLCQAIRQSVWILDGRASGDKFLSAPKRQIPLSGLKQAEAITFEDNDTVVITNEQREMFRLRL